MSNGWEESADAWIEAQDEGGDWSRQFVLDPVMLQRVDARSYVRALDVGCGEGRFCRLLEQRGITVTGLDPTQRLIDEAVRRDPHGDYRNGVAESLPFAEDSFDLVISYLSLIDIEDYRTAIKEMARVLAPGGTLLIANLAGHATANPDGRWLKDIINRKVTFRIDEYLTEQARWAAWGGIRIKNWHRPLSAYMRVLLAEDLTLVFFDEPPAVGGSAAKADAQQRVPLFVIMEWKKAAATVGQNA